MAWLRQLSAIVHDLIGFRPSVSVWYLSQATTELTSSVRNSFHSFDYRRGNLPSGERFITHYGVRHSVRDRYAGHPIGLGARQWL